MRKGARKFLPLLMVCIALLCMATVTMAQTPTLPVSPDTVGTSPLSSANNSKASAASADSTHTSADFTDSICTQADSLAAASLLKKKKKVKMPRDWSTWRPNPQRAMWLAMVIPGGGQIYNRKYWKLPIIYGGIIGCVYAINWNNMMYKDYSQAYLDIMDSDPNTCSYNKFLHLGRQIDKSNEERYKQIFKSRKDKYRRWRDMSVFCLIGVYAFSIIDAYVDAQLSEFDISKDLTLRVEPTMLNGSGTGSTQWNNMSPGVNCSLKF